MAILKTYSKQPNEHLDYDIYYRNSPDGAKDFLNTGDYLDDTKTLVSASPTGLIVNATTLRSKDMVKLWVSGGTSGIKDKITIQVTTDLGRIKEDELIFRIRDI